MSKPYDLIVAFDRVQPLTSGLEFDLRQALSQSRKVLLLIGGPRMARSSRNPFSLPERFQMLRSVFLDEIESDRLRLRPLDDEPYDDAAWSQAVRREVLSACESADALGNKSAGEDTEGRNSASHRVGLLWRAASSLGRGPQRFPEWQRLDLAALEGAVGAEAVCRSFLAEPSLLPEGACPAHVVPQLEAFRQSGNFRRLAEEARYVAEYRASWAASPFPAVFVTVDCVVRQAGHVLLIRRGIQPALGLLAFPGGFIGIDERIRDSAIRELQEETTIADGNGPLSAEELSRFIDDSATRVFDLPERSGRGRTITHAFLFNLPDGGPMYRVKAGDDAAQAGWHLLEEVNQVALAEDHWYILKSMTAR